MPQWQVPAAFYDPCAISFDPGMMISLIADVQIRKAIERGDFDNLPGAGKPLDLSDSDDPDWWFKALMKREGLAVLPPSIQLRQDDAGLDELLDQQWIEADVRREIEQFNQRVIRARYSLPVGPPLITMPRDVEATVAAWAERRTERRRQARRRAEDQARAREEAWKEERSRMGWLRRLLTSAGSRPSRSDP
ncbi:MAG: DUF1992 domain-containing protein [Galactobacter sp.]